MKKSALTILFFTMFLVMLGFGVIIPHMAYYADDLGANSTQIGFLMASYSAMQLVFAPLWGRLSDRHGRKPIILIGLVGNAGALALFAVSKTLSWLFIARSLSGALSAAVLPTVMAYVADVTTEEARGRGMGLMGAAMGLGFIFGPAIGGVMGNHSVPFLTAGGLSLVTFFFAMVLLPESLKTPHRLEESEQRTSPWRVLNQPLIPLLLVAFFSTFVFSGLETIFPLFIKDRFDYGAREMGWMFFVMGLLIALLQGAALGRLINRFGEFTLIITGLLINALGMALLPWSVGFGTMTVFLSIAGIGNQIIRPTNTSWISKQTKVGQGAVIGVMDAFLSLGRILGPPVAGRLYTPDTFQLPYLLLGGILILASISLFRPLRRIGR